MYTSHNLAISIKKCATEKNIVIKKMLEDCGLGSNTMSSLYHGKSISFDKLARIADYLECSVDYLLGRTNAPLSHPDEQTKELFKIFDTLSTKDKDKVIGFASALKPDNVTELEPTPRHIIGSAAAYGGGGVVSKRTEDEDKEVSQLLWDEQHKADE